MIDFLSESLFFGIVLTLLAYEIGLWANRKFKLAIFHPILIAGAIVIGVLLLSGISYDAYNSSAQHITYLLTPTTVCLAVPLYSQIDKLRAHKGAVFGGILAGVLTNLATICGLSMLFKLSHTDYVTLLPKSITTAIAIPLTEEYGGIVPITVAAITITGILGSVIASGVCRLFRITDPVAEGLAIGTAAHAAGTTRALELGETQGAMSSLAIAVAGVLTVVIAPFFIGLY